MISILQVIGKRRKLLLGLGLLALLGIASLVPARTPLIRDHQGGVVPSSVAILEQVTLGGMEQNILVRGRDKRNPVLLFLHGGPGYPQIAYARQYQQELENHFTVVNWDQRGAGKSYRWGMTEDDLQVNKFVQDTHELTNYLRKTFNQSKIFLAGHSWGSLLGIWTAQKYPDDYYAYIGIGQVANSPEGERLSYEFALREAEARSNEERFKPCDRSAPLPIRIPAKIRRWSGSG
ncbi:alpha/beta fold hydrolase [Paenibacillus tyrfis]|uniref:alpha/beta fold hydrolase n=1 Tax=Paenibacillus tyrfis TaxID=1501230 RepID=UPI00068E68A4|nr:alpha/beta fold hydrolase [Paenibacillus tyrfis]